MKAGGKKANAWGVINKGRRWGLCSEPGAWQTGRAAGIPIDEIWFTSAEGNIHHLKIKQGACAHLKKKKKIRENKKLVELH